MENNNQPTTAPQSSTSKAEMPKMDERQKKLFLDLSKKYGSWDKVIATLNNVANDWQLRGDVETDPRWDLCRKAAQRVGINWKKLADELFYQLSRIGIVHGNDPYVLNQALWPIINYGLNPMLQGELHLVKFSNWFQVLIGVNGIYRLTSEDPRFLNSECTFSNEMVQVGVVSIEKKGDKNTFAFPKLCPVSCTCRITFKDKDGQIRETSKTRFLSDCWRNSSAWLNSPAEMLSARAFTSAAKVVLGLAMSDEGIVEGDMKPKMSSNSQDSVSSSTSPIEELVAEDLEIDLS